MASMASIEFPSAVLVADVGRLQARRADGGRHIPEISRPARLGQKMKGIARIYDHVTDAMRQQMIDALEARWAACLLALTATERSQLMSWFP